MRPLIYDGSFDGFLSVVFTVYQSKLSDVGIFAEGCVSGGLVGPTQTVLTDKAKALRVWNGLEQKLTPRACMHLYRSFLSEQKDIENVMLRYIQYVFGSKKSIEYNYGNADVLTIQQTGHKVFREKHRMEAFVSFQLTKDGLLYAVIQPDHNVLPLICSHFRERYADQRWLIYDSRRKYGLYYDLQDVKEVQMQFEEGLEQEKTIHTVYDDREELYQQLWRQYFDNVNVEPGKNIKLHIQHMPRRYWKHLREKTNDFDLQ